MADPACSFLLFSFVLVVAKGGDLKETLSSPFVSSTEHALILVQKWLTACFPHSWLTHHADFLITFLRVHFKQMLLLCGINSFLYWSYCEITATTTTTITAPKKYTCTCLLLDRQRHDYVISYDNFSPMNCIRQRWLMPPVVGPLVATPVRRLIGTVPPRVF